MTVYDPQTYRTLVARPGEVAYKFYSVNKLMQDMAAAGLVALVAAVDAPADTSMLWLDLNAPEAEGGVTKAYSGGAWVVLTRYLFFAHIGALGGAIVTLTGDVTGTGASPIATTLATVNGTTGAFGSSSAVATFTVNGKGLITAAGSTAIAIPATALTGLGTGVATWLGTPTSANLAAAITDETGSGALVFANTPTLIAPLLGTPTSGVATNLTGLPIATGVSGLAAGVAVFLGTPSSANLITAVTDETGTGALVFATSPTLVTPNLGTPASGVATNFTGTAAGLTTGTVTTNANLTGVITSAGNATSIASQTGTGTKFVVDASPTLTGTPLTPTAANGTNTAQMASTAYVLATKLNQFAAPTSAVALNAQQITGLADPALAQDAATKAYVDLVAQGFSQKPTARLATTAALAANTYANGTAGVGATLTASAVGILTVDSVNVVLNDIILVKNEAAGANNGLYKCTTAGTAGVAYVLTRQVNMDSSAEFYGAFIPVDSEGTTNASSLWLNTNVSAPTVGTTAITFVQLNKGTDLAAGANITITGNVVALQTSPSFTTPNINVATATTVNKVTVTAPASAATLTLTDGTTLTGPAASGTAMTLGNTETVTGFKTFGAVGNVGKLLIAGTTSGSTTLNATAAASGVVSLPAATDTLVGKATTDTLTNKTFDTAGAGNAFSINSVAVTANTGTGAVVRATAPAIVGGTVDALTSFGVRSTGAAFDIKLASSEAVSATRTVSVTTGNVDRTLTFTANASIGGTTSGTNTGDQTITLTGPVTGTGTGSFATTIVANVVTSANLRQGAGLSVIGVTGSATANEADIVGVANQVLRVNGAGTALAFGALDLAQAAAVTNALPIANGGTAQTTAILARGSTGLAVENYTGTGDANYTILATDQTVGTSAAFTAARIWTLPAANAVNKGQRFFLADFAGGVTATNTLTISRAGADTINGGTSVIINAGNGAFILVSDGVSKWSSQAIGSSAVSGVSSFGGSTGAIGVGYGLVMTGATVSNTAYGLSFHAACGGL